MYLRPLSSVLLFVLVAGCAGPAVHSVELMDEATGMTAGALDKPVAFVETGLAPELVDPSPKQASLAYLGPVEWDRSGELTYVLWLQIAPGVGAHRLDDISALGAVNLELDDGPLALSPTDQSKGLSSPYRPVAPIGQIAYFKLDPAMLKRMAGSQKLVLNLRAPDLTRVDFVPVAQPGAALKQFLHDRNIGGD